MSRCRSHSHSHSHSHSQARSRFAVAVALALAFAIAPRLSLADDDEAIAAMRRGVAAAGRGDSEEALREYEAAKRAAPLANMPYRYAAETLLTLGRYVEAVENLEASLAKKPDVSDAQDVRDHIAKIRAEHFPARARVVANVALADVIVDGESRGATELLETTPGRHRIEVRASGHEPASQAVTLIGDQETSLVFTLAPVRAAEPPPVPPAPPEGASPGPWRTIGWAAGGVGAATLIVTVVIDAAVLGPKISDYRSAADRGDPAARSLRDDARGLQTGTLVGYVAGGALLAGGAALVLFAPHAAPAQQGPAATSGLRIRPLFAPTCSGIAASSTF